MAIFAIEGVNGVGKTTLAQKLCTYYDRLNPEFVRLPGWAGSDACVQIRKILEKGDRLDILTRLNLYVADMNEFFLKHDKNKLYFIDRSWLSTIVYQTYDGVTNVHKYVEHLQPYVDACLLLTCAPHIVFERLNLRTFKTLGAYKDRSEEYYDAIQHSYKSQLYLWFQKSQVRIIDTTTKNQQEVLEEAVYFFEEILNAKTNSK